MKKITLLLLFLAWLCAGPLHAQKFRKHKASAWSGIKKRNLLANDAWQVTSTQQSRLAEFNGELESQSKKVTISYKKGHFKFQVQGEPKSGFSVKADYDKSELGVVYFVPKSRVYSRITIHKKDKLIVLEGVDLSMTSYEYGKIEMEVSNNN
ncbi:MAG: hypothetical protein F6K42_28965 [Leptolyngbya sp. SIO1D8]|nr:hypothetical protein [Leptolyngbya sp. SIO1D8]